MPKKSDISFSLNVQTFKQGKQYVAYTPTLDLSSCGKTPAQAKRNLSEAAVAFFEELDEMGTTAQVLEELGWVHRTARWAPPAVEQSHVTLDLPVFA